MVSARHPDVTPRFDCGRAIVFGRSDVEPSHELLSIALLDEAGVPVTRMIRPGGRDHVPVDFTQLAQAITTYRARFLILLHNHPSGNPYPSLEDVRTSRSVVALARMMGARLLDHVITADGARFSFRDEGLI
jgi:DNA repair protein RadC